MKAMGVSMLGRGLGERVTAPCSIYGDASTMTDESQFCCILKIVWDMAFKSNVKRLNCPLSSHASHQLVRLATWSNRLTGSFSRTANIWIWRLAMVIDRYL